MPLFLAGGFAVAWPWANRPPRCAGRAQQGWSGSSLTVLVWHITGAVNSLAHLWGYRSYQTDDDSRNNWVVALIASGEGWHNNHHAHPRSARHGHRWWEVDNTWLTIRFLERTVLATDVVVPNAHLKGRPANTKLVTRGSNGVPVD